MKIFAMIYITVAMPFFSGKVTSIGFFKTLKESSCYGLLWSMGYLSDYIVDDVRYIKSFWNKHGHAVDID